MSMPRPPGAPAVATVPLGDDKEMKGQLSENEYTFILDSTLRDKHRTDEKIIAFIDSFVRCKSIPQASSEVGVHARIGYQWRHKQDIAHAIQKLIDRSAVKHGFDASELIERAKEMVDFDPIDLQNPDGTFRSNMAEIPPEARRNIKKFEAKNLYGEHEDMNGVKTRIVTGVLIKVEFYDKQKAIEMIGKEKDLFKNTTKVEHTISNNMAEFLLESVKRGAQASVDYKKVVEVQGTVVDHE